MSLSLYDQSVKGSRLKAACYNNKWVLSKSKKAELGKDKWAPHWTNALLDKSMLLVPETDYDMFMELYFNEGQVPWYITERTFAGGFVYFIDLDIHTGRAVQPAELHAVLERIIRVVGSIYSPDKPMDMLVASCEPYVKKDKLKCGYHLLFPSVVCTKEHALCLRSALLAELKRHAPAFCDIDGRHVWDDILDESVYDDGKGLRMLRAGKCAPCNNLVVQLPNARSGTTRRTCGRYQDTPYLKEEGHICGLCNNVGTARLAATPYDATSVYTVSPMPGQNVEHKEHVSALGKAGALWTKDMRCRWSINARGRPVTEPGFAAYPELRCKTPNGKGKGKRTAEYLDKYSERAYSLGGGKGAGGKRQVKLVGKHMADTVIESNSPIGACIQRVLTEMQFPAPVGFCSLGKPTRFSPFKDCYPRKVLIFQPESSNPRDYDAKSPWAAVHLSGVGSTWCPNKGGYHNSNTVWLHVSEQCIRIYCWKSDGACKTYKGHVCRGSSCKELWDLLKAYMFIGGGPLSLPPCPDSPPLMTTAVATPAASLPTHVALAAATAVASLAPPSSPRGEFDNPLFEFGDGY